MILDWSRVQDFTISWLEENLGPLRRSSAQPQEVHFRCPFCTKPDREGHYYYSLTKCCGFCRRGCHSGSIFDLMRDYGGYSENQINQAKKDFGYALTSESVSRQIDDIRKKMKLTAIDSHQSCARMNPLIIPIPEPVADVSASRFPQYLRRRNVLPRDLADLQVEVKMGLSGTEYRWVGDDGTEKSKNLRGYLIFPLSCPPHRSFEAYRTFPSEFMSKTWFPPPPDSQKRSISSSDLLFLYERFKNEGVLTLVEGIFDALAVARLDIPVMSVLSNKISSYQCVLLANLPKIKEIIVSLDADTQISPRGGASPERKFIEILKQFVSARISVVRLERGDPDEADPDEYLNRWSSREIVKY